MYIHSMHHRPPTVNRNLAGDSTGLFEPPEALSIRWVAHLTEPPAPVTQTPAAQTPAVQPFPSLPRFPPLLIWCVGGAAIGAALVTLSITWAIWG